MPTKLFIASLPTCVKKGELISFFSNYGEIKRVELVTQSNSRKGKGFAFVTFIKEEDAQAVLNQQIFFKGRQLSIRKHLKGRELEKYRENFTNRRMFVGGVPLECEESELYSTFSHIGEIEKAYLIEDKQNQRVTKYGYVVFKTLESIEKALKKKFKIRGVLVKCQKFKGKSGFSNQKDGQSEENKKSSEDFGENTKSSKKDSKTCGEVDFNQRDSKYNSRVVLRFTKKIYKNHYRSNISHNWSIKKIGHIEVNF